MNLMNQINYLEEFDLPLMFSECSVPEPLVFDDVVSAIVKKCGLLTPLYSEPETMRELTRLWFRTNQWNFQHLVNIILAEYSPIENTDRYSDHTVTRADDNSVTYGGTDTRTESDSGKDTTTTTEGTTGTSKETHSGADSRSVANGGQDVITAVDGGTDTTSSTNTRAAFNTAGYDPYDKTDSSTTHGRTETTTSKYGGTTSDSLTHGEVIDGTENSSRNGSEVISYGRSHTDVLTRATTEHRTGDGTESYTEHTHGNIGVTTNQEMINQELEMLKRFNVYNWIAAKYERDMCIQLY